MSIKIKIQVVAIVIVGSATTGICSWFASRRTPVTIPFAVEAHGHAVSCDPNTKVSSGFALEDLRFFVHDIQLLSADGTRTSLELTNDGIWQDDGVALLDFEDGTGNCENGTKGTHTALVGSAPSDNYTGIELMIGVPFSRNHGDVAVAPPPLNLGRMHWGWQAGYKFLRLEGIDSDAQPYRLHLGSTGCTGTFRDVTGCARPNRAKIRLDGYQPGHSTIVIDLGRLLVTTAGDAPQPSADSIGCMSAEDDPDCRVAFAALGLDLQSGLPVAAQRLFSIRQE